MLPAGQIHLFEGSQMLHYLVYENLQVLAEHVRLCGHTINLKRHLFLKLQRRFIACTRF